MRCLFQAVIGHYNMYLTATEDFVEAVCLRRMSFYYFQLIALVVKHFGPYYDTVLSFSFYRWMISFENHTEICAIYRGIQLDKR